MCGPPSHSYILVIRQVRKPSKYELYYHIFAWLPPALLVLFMVLDQLGSTQTLQESQEQWYEVPSHRCDCYAGAICPHTRPAPAAGAGVC